jgi:hypothetical protein
MIQFRDFVPQQVKGKWHEGKKYEDFEAAVAAAGQWLGEAKITPVQIETVALPNIGAPHEDGTTDAALGTTSGWATWHQFLRIWY